MKWIFFILVIFCSCRPETKKNATVSGTINDNKDSVQVDSIAPDKIVINTDRVELNLKPRKINLPDGDSFFLNIPENYNISIAAMLNSRLRYFKNFKDAIFNNSVLVCLHGSTSAWRQRGNSIVRLAAGNRYTEVISGFLTGKSDADRHGRPCDVMMNDNHSFFFTDDLKGVLYYVWKEQ